MNWFDRTHPLGNPCTERIMDWSGLVQLHKAGWSIQSHGCSHRPADTLPGPQIEDEIRRSKIEIEDRVGGEVFAFAYAYGAPPTEDSGSSLAWYFEPHGYRYCMLACGGRARVPPPDPFRVPRVPVTGGAADEILGLNATMANVKQYDCILLPHALACD